MGMALLGVLAQVMKELGVTEYLQKVGEARQERNVVRVLKRFEREEFGMRTRFGAVDARGMDDDKDAGEVIARD